MDSLRQFLKEWKDAFEAAYYVLAIVAAIWAFKIYRSNSRLERARWLSTLYDKFYENDRLKEMRNLLDCPDDESQVEIGIILKQEDPRFTDYLNFFEYVTILYNSKQLSYQEVEDLFSYYLDCLDCADCPEQVSVRGYIKEKGYERLNNFLEYRRCRKESFFTALSCRIKQWARRLTK